ncbi:DUF6087 family protein [Streptomyces subrutilus]|uniref:DUF6087 family protein n=1 Tax=Streptomyces subrutilus TaxID=36818 RepID=UPI00279553CA|nr:DUF6087 family protein [Streptomyces subrutilus]
MIVDHGAGGAISLSGHGGMRARRRGECRARSKGRLRAVPLTAGPHRGVHVEPGAPRVIEEWDGSRWVTVGLVDGLVAAKACCMRRGRINAEGTRCVTAPAGGHPRPCREDLRTRGRAAAATSQQRAVSCRTRRSAVPGPG